MSDPCPQDACLSYVSTDCIPSASSFSAMQLALPLMYGLLPISTPWSTTGLGELSFIGGLDHQRRSCHIILQ